MGLLTPEVNGARQELPCLESPEVNGARQEIASVKKYVNGAWQEIWSAIKYMKMLEETLTVAEANYATSGSTIKWCVDGSDENDGGYVTYYLDGEFSSPTISLMYEGYYNVVTSSGDDRYASAGDIYLYTRKTSGTENYVAIDSSVNTSESEAKEYSTTLSGDYDRIGIKIDLSAWSSGNNSPQYLYYYIEFWNFLIDGKECIPSEDCII